MPDWRRPAGGGQGPAAGTAGQWRRHQRGVRRGAHTVRQVSVETFCVVCVLNVLSQYLRNLYDPRNTQQNGICIPCAAASISGLDICLVLHINVVLISDRILFRVSIFFGMFWISFKFNGLHLHSNGILEHK